MAKKTKDDELKKKKSKVSAKKQKAPKALGKKSKALPPKASKKKAKKSKDVTPMKSGKIKLNEKNLIVCSPVNADLKPAWYEIRVTTEADGMLGSKIQGRRYVGAIEADKDERKVFDMNEYEPEILRGIQARLAAVTFHATGKVSSKGVPSRLQPKTEYILHCRVAVTKENTLKASVNKVFVEQANKKGKVVLTELDKKDYQVRKLRKVNKYLAIAFREAQMPPKPERKSRRVQAEDE